MSRALTKADQRPLGAYYTPDDVAQKCVAVIADDVQGRSCLEPSAGGGAFMRALQAVGAVVAGCDVDIVAPTVRDGMAVCHDFMAMAGPDEPFELPRWDWIVGNPPYNEAQAHVERAIALADIGCAFLLRLAFLESEKRAAFWRLYPPAEVHVLSRRPSFTGGGTDSAAYAFFVWRRSFTGSPVMGWI